jgi:acyl-CoA thioester hydrolase
MFVEMAFLETFRSVVAPSECDVLGHMNVSRYFAACSDGVFSFQTMLGLGVSKIRHGRKLSFAVVHAESDFLSEVHAGEVIYLLTGIEKNSGKSLVFKHRLFKAESEELAFETRFQCVMLDLEARRGAEIPDDVREKAKEFIIQERT